MAASYVELGILEREEGRPAESLASCQQGVELCQTLVRDVPDKSDYLMALSWAYENLGSAELAARQTGAAVVSCDTAVRMCEELVRKSDGEINRRADLGRAYTDLAMAQFANGQMSEAESNHRQAMELRGKLIQDGPAVDLYKHLTASSCHALADVLRANGAGRGPRLCTRRPSKSTKHSSPRIT